ncbi:MAG TPA: phage tail protein, partial [Pyrinomonadaceae bacterium]
MQASNVRAEADARGGRIRLSWTAPRKVDFPGFKGVKIVRRENSFPDPEQVRTDPGLHLDTKTKAGEEASFTDTGLRGETNYYYAVAAYDASQPPNYFPVFVSALATSAYGTAEQLYEWLPALYKRYDTLRPPVVAQLDPADREKGQLRRLVEMFGAEFDLLRSYASAARDFSDVSRVDGALLPLLAQWLGWPTDYSLPFSKQRNEIKYAPHFYRTTGIAANLRATLNRLTTWNAEVKEFVHNIFNANNPEQLAVWEATRRAGVWDEPRVASVDVAYEGRLASVRESRERHWLFYHSRRRAHRAAPDGSQFCAPGDYSHLYF